MRTRLLRKAKKAVKLYRGHKGGFFISVQGVPMYAVTHPSEAQTLYRLAVRAAARRIAIKHRSLGWSHLRHHLKHPMP